MKHLKYFEEASAYEAFKNSGDYILPNVSYIAETDSVTYEPEASFDYIMVDLGLPSGLKWADRNVGATSPEDAGLYFQWGDTLGTTTTFNTATYPKYLSNKYGLGKLTKLEPEDDAAAVNMGANWRMPTKADFEELRNNTTIIGVDVQGVEHSDPREINQGNIKGFKCVGSNGNSIFIPAAGSCIYNNQNYLVNISGNLWSSELSSTSGKVISIEIGPWDQLFKIMELDHDGAGDSVRGVCN